jgi:hypothetical protein
LHLELLSALSLELGLGCFLEPLNYEHQRVGACRFQAVLQRTDETLLNGLKKLWLINGIAKSRLISLQGDLDTRKTR